jgi:hypothetical protein
VLENARRLHALPDPAARQAAIHTLLAMVQAIMVRTRKK